MIHKKDSNLKWHWHILGRLPTLYADISVFVYEFLMWVCQYDKAQYHGSLIWNSPLDTSHKEIKVSCCPPKLKVSKFQKQIFFSSFIILIRGYLTKIVDTFFYLTYSRPLGQKSKNNFLRFLVQTRARKFASEIYWSLV